MMEGFDPQEVLIKALARLEAGWVKGALRGHDNGRGGGQDPSGVCTVGAIQDTLLQICIDRVQELEPFDPMAGELWKDYSDRVMVVARTLYTPLSAPFRELVRLSLAEQTGINDVSIESWNDQQRRAKTDVVSLLERTIADVMTLDAAHEAQTILAEEAAADEAKIERALNAFQGTVDRVGEAHILDLKTTKAKP